MFSLSVKLRTVCVPLCSRGGALSTSTYGEVSPISLGENVAKPKVIFLGPNKIETMFMIFFIPKHRLSDISGFDRGNPDCCFHCFGIFYVHVQVSKYKMS